MTAKPRGTGVRGHRLNPNQTERSKSAIATTQIIKRLNAFVNNDQDENGNVITMLPHQVTAALGLLKKVIPDLQSVEGNMNVRVSHEDTLTELETAAQIDTSEQAIDASYH